MDRSRTERNTMQSSSEADRVLTLNAEITTWLIDRNLQRFRSYQHGLQAAEKSSLKTQTKVCATCEKLDRSYGCFLVAGIVGFVVDGGVDGVVGFVIGIDVGFAPGPPGFILSYRSMMSLVTSIAVEIQITFVF